MLNGEISAVFNAETVQKILNDKSFEQKAIKALIECCGYSEEEANNLPQVLKMHQPNVTGAFLKKIGLQLGILQNFANALDITWSRIVFKKDSISYETPSGKYSYDLDNEIAEGIFSKCEGSIYKANPIPSPDQIIAKYDAGVHVTIKI